MRRSVQKKIEELHMIATGDRVLVGVSGGADSVCLLLILQELCHEMDFSVEAVHVEHGIRGAESQQDADFVENLCQRLQVPLHTIPVDVPSYCSDTGMGLEEAARELRYKAFVQLAWEQNAKIALAHHMEDNAETMLFQLLRGSSLTGLCGMQPIRRDDSGVTYIRPLLHIHREDIECYLQSCGQEYRVDSTNAELDYSRNYIRNIILPELRMVNAQAVAHMNTTAGQLADIRDFLAQETEKAWQQVIENSQQDNDKNNTSITETAARCLTLNISKFELLHPALQKEVLYKAIAYMMGGRKDVAMVHVVDVLALCRNQSGKQIHLAGGLIAQKEYQQLKFSYKKEEELNKNEDILTQKGNDIYVLSEMLAQSPLEIFLNENGEKLSICVFPHNGKNAEIPQKPYTKWMDYDKIKEGFCIRTRRSGDVFIGDSQGHRKKLKQYMIDEKIPVSKRDEMWLLAQDNTVLWLIGGRMSEHIKVTANTKNIIEITYDGGY